MRHKNTNIALHWVSALSILTAVFAVIIQDLLDDTGMSHLLVDLHRSLGITVMLLVLVRLLVGDSGQLNTTKSPAVPIQKLMPRLAKPAHRLIYLMLIAVPALGWAHSSATGKPISFFWVTTIPSIVARNRDLAEQLQDWHEIGAWSLLVMVCLHVLAALIHQFYLRDGVLYSMLPLKRLFNSLK